MFENFWWGFGVFFGLDGWKMFWKWVPWRGNAAENPATTKEVAKPAREVLFQF